MLPTNKKIFILCFKCVASLKEIKKMAPLKLQKKTSWKKLNELAGAARIGIETSAVNGTECYSDLDEGKEEGQLEEVCNAIRSSPESNEDSMESDGAKDASKENVAPLLKP